MLSFHTLLFVLWPVGHGANIVKSYNRDVNYDSHRQQWLACKVLTSGYNRNIRPPGTDFDGTGPVYVVSGLQVNSFSSMSDSLMQFQLRFRIKQRWNDNRLAWRHLTKHWTRDYITLPRRDLTWRPDTFFQNEREGHYHQVDVENAFMRVSADGDVVYDRRLTMTFACSLYLVRYPHDVQHCFVDFASYAYTTKDIVYQWNDFNPIELSNDSASSLPQFHVEKHWNASCTSVTNTGTYSCLRVVIRLRRVFSFFLLQLYIPSIMLVFVSYVSYWIDWRASPARIPLAIVTLLTMITQSHAINSNLPPVSYIKAIDIWISGCIVFIFASLLEYAVVNFLGLNEELALQRQITANAQKSADVIDPATLCRLSNEQAALEGLLLGNHCYVDLEFPPGSDTLAIGPWSNPGLRKRFSTSSNCQNGTRQNSLAKPVAILPVPSYSRVVADSTPDLSGRNAGAFIYVRRAKRRHDILCGVLMKTLRKRSMADRIDYIARAVIPILFLAFNAVYWGLYTISDG